MEEEKGIYKMSSKALLITLTLILIAFLSWQLRLVLLILFSSVVISVGLDLLIENTKLSIVFI